jgi:hypothetical protein
MLSDYLKTYLEQDDIVIIGTSRKMLESIAGYPGWACITNIMRPDGVHRRITAFEEGKYKGLAISYQYASCGIKLERPKTLLFLDRHPDENFNLQAIRCVGDDSKIEYM